MKMLTLTEPWASLVAYRFKRMETRSWKTPYRGPVGIHAAKGLPGWAAETFWHEGPLRHALRGVNAERASDGDDPLELLPGYRPGVYFLPTRGKVLAYADLVDVVTTSEVARDPEKYDLTGEEYAMGDFSKGRYAWILENVMRLREPIPAKGSLGLWEWDAPVEVALHGR